MIGKLIRMSLVVALFAAWCLGTQAQAQARKTGSTTGEIKSSKKSPNGVNQIVEVLAPGEEKARPYRVMYDPEIKAPKRDVLAAVREAKVGDQVKFDWVDTGEGLAITKFEVVKKAGGADK